MDPTLIPRLAREAGFEINARGEITSGSRKRITQRLAHFAALVAEEAAKEAEAFIVNEKAVNMTAREIIVSRSRRRHRPGYSREVQAVSRYAGNIKVVGEDLMCFPADPKTLEPLGTGCYDPWAWKDPEPAVETISLSEWQRRRNAQRDAERFKP